jgi:hypothetical protein
MTDLAALTEAELVAHCQHLDLLDEADTQRLNTPGLLGKSALYYASHGWAVFPLWPKGKLPRIGRKQGGQGFMDATCEPGQVTEWWTRWPQANIGMPTGVHFDVIDIDVDSAEGKHAAYLHLADMRDEGIIPPLLAKAATPRGGQHLYIAPTGDGNAAGIRPDVDYRDLGGYVVAPPSIGETGRRYAWLDVPDFAALAAAGVREATA